MVSCCSLVVHRWKFLSAFRAGKRGLKNLPPVRPKTEDDRIRSDCRTNSTGIADRNSRLVLWGLWAPLFTCYLIVIDRCNFQRVRPEPRAVQEVWQPPAICRHGLPAWWPAALVIFGIQQRTSLLLGKVSFVPKYARSFSSSKGVLRSRVHRRLSSYREWKLLSFSSRNTRNPLWRHQRKKGDRSAVPCLPIRSV